MCKNVPGFTGDGTVLSSLPLVFRRKQENRPVHKDYGTKLKGHQKKLDKMFELTQYVL